MYLSLYFSESKNILLTHQIGHQIQIRYNTSN